MFIYGYFLHEIIVPIRKPGNDKEMSKVHHLIDLDRNQVLSVRSVGESSRFLAPLFDQLTEAEREGGSGRAPPNSRKYASGVRRIKSEGAMVENNLRKVVHTIGNRTWNPPMPSLPHRSAGRPVF